MTEADFDTIPTEELIKQLQNTQLGTLSLGKGYQTTMTFAVCVTVEYKAEDGSRDEEHFWDLEEAEEAAHRWREERRAVWEAKQ
jgi:hypothetical protein